MADYHLLFSSEYHYLPYIFTTCQSILDTLEDGNSNDQLLFHLIIDDSVSSKQLQAMIKLFSDSNAKSKVGFSYDVYHANPDVFEGFEKMQRGSWSTTSNYYRLLFARMLPPNINRILYLDVDIMLCDDVRKMFQQFPMGKEVLYAASCPYGMRIAKNLDDQEPVRVLDPKSPSLAALKIPVKNYFNSGVMLINVDQWEQQNIEAKCLDIANDWITPIHDQDLLNAACAGRVTYMSWDWNMSFDMYDISVAGGITCNNTKLPLDKILLNDAAPAMETLASLVENPRLIHFTRDKPWDPKVSEIFTIQSRSEVKARWSQHQRWSDLFKRLSPIYRKAKQLYQNL